MDTSKYDSSTRKNLKRFQRSSGYQAMKKDHAAAREVLEKQLRERSETIKLLKEKLVESGMSADDVAKLAKLAA